MFESCRTSTKSHPKLDHITKCASTSIGKMLYWIGGSRINWGQSWFDGYVSPDSLTRDIQCGFTFVRHPIHRFISGYYTMNLMLKGDVNKKLKPEQVEAMKEKLKHWEIEDECYYDFSCFERLHVFIDQLVDDSWQWINHYKDVLSGRVMEHVGSMSGHFLASYDGWNIDYIGKMEYFDEHWSLLSREISECSKGYLEKYWEEMENYDIANGTSADEAYKDMDQDGLAHTMKGYGQAAKHTLNRPLVDAYYALAMDRSLYERLAEYYYQDAVCFQYDTSYESFMEYILEHDPEFDADTLRPPLMKR